MCDAPSHICGAAGAHPSPVSPRPCLRRHPASVRRSGVQIPALPQHAPPDDRGEHQGGSDGRGCGSWGGVGGAQEYDSRSRPALCSAAENRGWEARHPLPPPLPCPFFWCPLTGPGPPLYTVSFSPPPPSVRPPLSPAGLARAPGSNQRRPPRTPSPPPPPARPPPLPEAVWKSSPPASEAGGGVRGAAAGDPPPTREPGGGWGARARRPAAELRGVPGARRGSSGARGGGPCSCPGGEALRGGGSTESSHPTLLRAVQKLNPFF